MPVKVTVLYPNESDATFDMKYYLATHMPLVSKNWEKLGLKGWEVCQVDAGMGGEKPQYNVVATLIYDNVEDFHKCVGDASAKEVFGDVPNFSNKGPVLLIGNSLATKSH